MKLVIIVLGITATLAAEQYIDCLNHLDEPDISSKCYIQDVSEPQPCQEGYLHLSGDEPLAECEHDIAKALCEKVFEHHAAVQDDGRTTDPHLYHAEAQGNLVHGCTLYKHRSGPYDQPVYNEGGSLNVTGHDGSVHEHYIVQRVCCQNELAQVAARTSSGCANVEVLPGGGIKMCQDPPTTAIPGPTKIWEGVTMFTVTASPGTSLDAAVTACDSAVAGAKPIGNYHKCQDAEETGSCHPNHKTWRSTEEGDTKRTGGDCGGRIITFNQSPNGPGFFDVKNGPHKVNIGGTGDCDKHDEVYCSFEAGTTLIGNYHEQGLDCDRGSRFLEAPGYWRSSVENKPILCGVRLPTDMACQDDEDQADRVCKGRCADLKNSCGKTLGCGSWSGDVATFCPVTCGTCGGSAAS